MTLTILATKPTSRTCDTHRTPIVELLVSGTELESDWVITVCEDCYSASGDTADLRSVRTPRYPPTTTAEADLAKD